MSTDASFHDATLVSVYLSWAEGCCTMAVSTTYDGDGELVFENVCGVSIPRRHPWGPSVSIKEGLNNSRFRLASAQNTENLTDRRPKL
jgi:hypothetical protein